MEKKLQQPAVTLLIFFVLCLGMQLLFKLIDTGSIYGDPWYYVMAKALAATVFLFFFVRSRKWLMAQVANKSSQAQTSNAGTATKNKWLLYGVTFLGCFVLWFAIEVLLDGSQILDTKFWIESIVKVFVWTMLVYHWSKTSPKWSAPTTETYAEKQEKKRLAALQNN